MNFQTFNTYNDIVNAWGSKSLDAIILICSHTHPFVKAFSLQYKIKFLDLDTSKFTDYQQKMLQFNFITLKNTSFPLSDKYRSSSIQKSVKTIGMRMVLCTNQDVSEDHVYTLINRVFDNFLNIKQGYEGMQMSDLYYTQFIFQYHPGAKKIYTEKGYITELESPYCKYFIGKEACTPELVEMAKILEERTTDKVFA